MSDAVPILATVLGPDSTATRAISALPALAEAVTLCDRRDLQGTPYCLALTPLLVQAPTDR